LVAATFFMVSGGAYGTEDIVHGAGYAGAILILLITPLVWSLPTAWMVGELSAAIPAEGGYYAWVRRGMGNFWGFQEAWLSLVASIFDMAIYPTLFVIYLTRLFPWFAAAHHGVMAGLLVVTICTAMNVAGIRVVGLTSLWMFLLLSAPFLLIVILAPFKAGALAGAAPPVHSSVGLIGGLLVAMWNYMGWDNASTIAVEVKNPQRIYPRALLFALVIIALSYVLPVAAMSVTKLSPAAWETGSWANLAGLVGGPWLRLALEIGGMMSAFGMMNALVMSYSRLPLAMAQDGMLPGVFARLHPRTRAPWVAILACSAGWALCLGLNFERLITLDVLLSGASLLLEFGALVALRIREPNLPRPFRVPGGTAGTIMAGFFPLLLLVFSVIRGDQERVLGMNGLLFGAILMVGGIVAYSICVLYGRSQRKHCETGSGRV
jgi:amino acid transporter